MSQQIKRKMGISLSKKEWSHLVHDLKQSLLGDSKAMVSIKIAICWVARIIGRRARHDVLMEMCLTMARTIHMAQKVLIPKISMVGQVSINSEIRPSSEPKPNPDRLLITPFFNSFTTKSTYLLRVVMTYTDPNGILHAFHFYQSRVAKLSQICLAFHRPGPTTIWYLLEIFSL